MNISTQIPGDLNTFFPPIEPHEQGMLRLDGRHSMYWEVSGNPRGVPVVFLHGGPGAGAGPTHRQFFDPGFYRVIIFDQRGAGRSIPLGELIDNTTPHLIRDMETLRRHLKVDKWLVFGGSWGSTLALAYAQVHLDKCLGLILRGIFLCRPSEIDWFLYGVKNIFPEAWREFAGHLPEGVRNNILDAYYDLLKSPDPAVHLPAARKWSVYEGSCSTLLPNADLVHHFAGDVVALGLARIEAHYFKHDIFLPPNSLLDNAHKLHPIPGVIVQGRYDAVCPPVSADDLHHAWPQAEYILVDDAGHSAFEPSIRSQLIAASERFKTRLIRAA
ncbi:MAG: prolyl aminopeptidase [Burkholderiales bacterium]